MGARGDCVAATGGDARIRAMAGVAAATIIKQGIAAHTSSAVTDWRKRAAVFPERRALQMAKNMAANTLAATMKHIARSTRMGYAMLGNSERRYALGARPTSLRNDGVKELVSRNPTSRAISVTDRWGSASSSLARSTRRFE
jgi:hypothetical protein